MEYVRVKHAKRWRLKGIAIQYRILWGALGMAMLVNLQDAKVYMIKVTIITWFRAQYIENNIFLSNLYI